MLALEQVLTVLGSTVYYLPARSLEEIRYVTKNNIHGVATQHFT